MNGRYGQLPIDLGFVNLNPSEMMFWLNCPIKLPYGQFVIPENLKQFNPIIFKMRDALQSMLHDKYVYLTVKTLYLNKGCPSNRPGWHSDGFMTDDINLIWYDSVPTVFWNPSEQVSIIQDHQQSLAQMSELCENGPFKTYPVKHLLMLNQHDIHKCGDVKEDGIRTFIKISVSKNKYDMEGNSINHALGTNWNYQKRDKQRNLQSTSEQSA